MNREQLKEKISRLTIEDQEKLKEYTDALREIKTEIKNLLNKGNMEEGGPMVNLTLPIEEE